MNAYEGKAGMVYLQVKLCDPCLSALRYTYKYASFPFFVVLCIVKYDAIHLTETLYTVQQ